jgi:pimeloyl-ACP methyl ester carboxylesterase
MADVSDESAEVQVEGSIATAFSRMSVRQFTGDGGISLVADEFGDPMDSPVIMLHGGGQSRSAWRSAASALSAYGYHAITVDMRGHGESDWSPDGDYAFDRYAADLAAMISQLGQPAILLGASHGGLSAIVTASTYPSCVRALALADVTPWLDEDHADGMRASLRTAAKGFATVEDAAAMVNSLRGTPPRSNNAGLRAHMREGEDGRLYWHWDPRFIEDRFVRHGGEGGRLVAAARDLPMPVLLMYGEFSNVVNLGQITAFQAALPSLRVVEIAGVGHMVTGDDNSAFLPPLIGFLTEVTSVSGSR